MPVTPRLLRMVLGAAAAAWVCALAPVAHGDDAACIDAVERGLMLRQKGQLHEALKVLAACTDPTCPAELRSECTQRVDAIGLAMPTLVLAAKDGAGNDLVNVSVTMDGTPLASTLDGRPVSVDPGEHDFRFETPGQPPVEKKLVLREGEKNRSESVVLGPPAPATTNLVMAQPEPRPPAATSSFGTQRALAVVSGAVGLAGLGLGIAWSAYAVSAQNQEKSNCGSAGGCLNRPQASEDYTFAQRNATGATIGISAGAVLVAAAVVLWFTAPTHKAAPTVGVAGLRIEPSILPSGGGIHVGGQL